MSTTALRSIPLAVILAGSLAGCETMPADAAVSGGGELAALAPPICPGSPYTTIQAAINATAAGGTVTVCSGTFLERLTISKSLTLKASSGAVSTIVDAQGWDTALKVTGGGTVVVDGFTFKNGGNAGDGGNVYCSATGLTIRNSTLSAGSAGTGGGISSIGCFGAIDNNTITGNSAGTGGGIYATGDTMAITGNDVTGNHTDISGGGIYLDGDSAIVGNFIDGNDSSVYGGGVFVNFGYGDVADNIISFNSSVDDGGGLYINDGGGSVDNNDIVDNYSDDDAGGLRLKLSTASVTNNVISRNLATNTGGAVKISHKDSIITGNTFADNEAYYYAGGVLLEESTGDFVNNTVTGNTSPNGGGLYIENAFFAGLIQDCLFAGNTTAGNGGNIYLTAPGQTITLRRVDMESGTANQGGGLYATATDVKITNSTFWKNNAWTAGGAAYFTNVTGTLTNDVAWGNTSAGGSALRISSGLALTVTNSVFQANTGSAAVHVSSGSIPTWKYNNMYGNTAGFLGMPPQVGINGNLAAKPSFTRPASRNFTLAVGSKLINKGDPAVFDVNGTRSDMGIFGGPEGY